MLTNLIDEVSTGGDGIVFHGIIVFLFLAAIPLWAYRMFCVSSLTVAERRIMKRFAKHRFESVFVFAAQIFGYLLAMAVLVIGFILAIGYLKFGTIQIKTYREMFHGRLYTGTEHADRVLNSAHYDQSLPVAVLMIIVFLTIGFTLVTVALRDIYLARRLHRKVSGRGLR
jgi:hypothetical protein